MTTADLATLLIGFATMLLAAFTFFYLTFKGLMDAKLQAIDTKVDAIKEAVDAGRREHEAFQAGLQNLQQQHNDLLLRFIPGTAPQAAKPKP